MAQKLNDHSGKARIIARIRSAEQGNFGDCKPVGQGISEMRIHTGPGYRIYFAQQDKIVYLLLNGGDKSTQELDIKRAAAIFEAFKKD